MMYSEFLEISNQDITHEQYAEVIEPMYEAVDMDKHDFIRFMMPSIRAMAKENEKRKAEEARKNQKLVFVSDGRMTPNGCWYLGKFGKLVRVDYDVHNGCRVFKVRELTADEARELAGHYDLRMNSVADIRTGCGTAVEWVK